MAGPQRFIRTASVTLDATGYGYCTVTAPSGVGWTVKLVTVSTNIPAMPPVVQPVASIYQDSAPNTSHLVEQTYTGNKATSNSEYELLGGESLTAEWSGGTAGSVGTLRVTGIQTERR